MGLPDAFLIISGGTGSLMNSYSRRIRLFLCLILLNLGTFIPSGLNLVICIKKRNFGRLTPSRPGRIGNHHKTRHLAALVGEIG